MEFLRQEYWGGLPFSSPAYHFFCYNSLPQPVCLGWPYTAWLTASLSSLAPSPQQNVIIFVSFLWLWFCFWKLWDCICPFHDRELKCWVGSQEIPRESGKFGLGVQNEAGQRLTEFCQENTLVIAKMFIQQHKRQLYIWKSTNGQNQNQTDYILCTENGEVLYSQGGKKKRRNTRRQCGCLRSLYK